MSAAGQRARMRPITVAKHQRHLGAVRRLAGAQDDRHRLAGGRFIEGRFLQNRLLHRPLWLTQRQSVGRHRPVRRHRLDLRRQPIASYLGNFDRRDVIFEHDVMDRLVEFEPRQPAAMQLGPGRP